MKIPNKLFLVLFVITAMGCVSTSSCPFDTDDDCETVTITAYLPPVVVDLDYQQVRGSKNQVIVQGGFQHVISMTGQKKTPDQFMAPQSLTFPLATDTDKVVSETESVLFEFDHSVIPVRELDKLSRFLHRIDSPGLMHIQIEGHTDSKGSAKYNKVLSIKRARAVGFYLTQHGIQPSKITINGFGEDLPLEPNNSEENRAKNRRVKLTPITSN